MAEKPVCGESMWTAQTWSPGSGKGFLGIWGVGLVGLGSPPPGSVPPSHHRPSASSQAWEGRGLALLLVCVEQSSPA